MGARGGYSLEMGCALRRQGDILVVRTGVFVVRTGVWEVEALRLLRAPKSCCKRPGSSRPPTSDDEGEFELRTLPALRRAA